MGKSKMTRYAFIEHMKDYMKELLSQPLKADTDDFLHGFGIDGPSALKMLLMKTDPNDEYSAIVIRNERIKDNGYDENGNKLKDTFEVKYKIPRKDFKKKLRNLYINLFEQNIIEDSPINEDLNYNEMPLSSTPNPFKDKKFGKVQSQCRPGSTGDRFAKYVNDNDNDYEPKLIDDEKKNLTEGAWGYDILDNDSALDHQSEFAGISLNVLCSKVLESMKDDFMDRQNLWANIGVLVDFLKKYKDDEIQLDEKYTYAINLTKNALRQLFNDENFINSWSEPKKIKSSLKKIFKDVSLLEYQKNVMNIDNQKMKPFAAATPPQAPINEDGEGGAVGGSIGGGTMPDMGGASTTFTTGNYKYDMPFKKKKNESDVIRKTGSKQIYVTEDQVKYIKEATATSNAGNYQYDVPLQGDDDFYGEAMDHQDIMKKSFEGYKK